MTRSWRISDDTAFVVSNPERAVLLNLAVPASQPIALLGTGAAVWRKLVGPEEKPRRWVAEAALLRQLAADYGTDSHAIAGDVGALLSQLAVDGYVLSTGSPASPAAAAPDLR